MATLIKSDLEFILQQIVLSERHAAGEDLVSLVPHTFAPFGVRTVDGSFNNLMPDQELFGSADQPFPRLVGPVYRNDADGDQFDTNGDVPGGLVTNTDYGAPGSVVDADPRVISNLIADMTSDNPAAVQAFVSAGLGTLDEDGTLRDLEGTVIPPGTLLTIPNVAPDEGLSAPFNSWFTLFGQFFDHGLDLVNKGGNETIFIPLQPDDPLYVEGGNANFMVLTRATPSGTTHTNQTTPLVDQNQTYTSHPSHQVFLREYELDSSGHPVATGRMLDGANGGLPTWADVKAQALTILGIQLDDFDVTNLPLVATDQYGKFIPDPDSGFPQIVLPQELVGDDSLDPDGDGLASGTPSAPIDASVAMRTGHAFLDDIAHSANPRSPAGVDLSADSDSAVGLSEPGTYDNELLDRHYITGDGRGNENIGLTAVHHVFHSEHNRQVAEMKQTITNSGDAAFVAEWHLPDGSWNGERLFQAARFATEMQYQHLVFEEFARKMQPAIDEFLPETNYDTTIDPAIFAEFAHAVFRVGHSMLTESIHRLDPDFQSNDVGLIDAFLNPLQFDDNGQLSSAAAAGAIIRGMTRQQGNAIDEFVTEAVRNNLLGLPLDLAAINIARGRDTGIPTLNAARAQFYEMTHDNVLKPYVSWVDFATHLRHEASIINFLAAYGLHPLIAAQTTLEAKRDAALTLVTGESVGGLDVQDDAVQFLNGTGAWASRETGLNDIDLWIGGLAEKSQAFDGMLGPTFNFVFETQLENLQNGDRFYYLSRLAGTNFLTELENNTFAKLVQLNTDVTRVPADIFSAPGFILEVDESRQHTGLGPDGKADPTEGGTALVPLVIRDNPATPGLDANYLQYTGGDHVVLGGTDSDDIIIGSVGDDTIAGDGGNDRLEGGYGNDQIEGGDGDDIITDRGGDDVLKGDAGDDVIHGGNGFNLIVGGPGKDFIVTGEDVSEVFAGPGDDFVLGAKGNLPTFGNEGDDWIELGTQDGTTGDSFDPLGEDPIPGNDVLISGGGFDELIGEGGDDIFTGSDGEDHFDGGSGFDWASYKFDKRGVTADMIVSNLVEPPVAPSNAGIMDRFAFTEGLSGSPFADILRGDDADALEIAQAGWRGSVLTNIGLIDGLQSLLDTMLGGPVTSFGSGNIILGGSGSDILMGRGGNDILDGDAWLNVRIAVAGHPLESVDSMKELVPYMLSGEIKPSQLSIVREILYSPSPDFDTAVFAGPRANYTVMTGPDGVTVVTDNVGTNAGTEGTDTLRNIERLQFADQAVILVPGVNNEPVGQPVINDTTPAVGQILTVSALGVTDADNVSPDNPTGSIVQGPVSYVWQYEPDPIRGAGVFRDIVNPGGDKPSTVDGLSLLVTPDLQGLALRVRAVYQDGDGVLETVYSASTQPVAAGASLPAPAAIPEETPVESAGVRYIRADLQFILDQIKISERHAAGEDILDIIPNSRMALGLRTVDGSLNNLVPGQYHYGAADIVFPRLLDPEFRNDQDGDQANLGPGGVVTNTDYGRTGDVADADPRLISNLIVDQTPNNPAAAGLGAPLIQSPGLDGLFGTEDDRDVFFIPNTAPDEGLSAPFNAWMTFFGQFFDHGLDFVNKGDSGTIFMPLEPGDPLYSDEPNAANFLVLTRASRGPGPDGVLDDDPDTPDVDESLDDVREARNATTAFVDQNQTYASHASHHAFLREYVLAEDGRPVATGRLLTNRDIGPDGTFGTNDDVEIGGMSTWAVVKAQARDVLGIELGDLDALDVPLLVTDPYGDLVLSGQGRAQLMLPGGVVQAGNPDEPIDASAAMRTGHMFLADIAHTATPVSALGQVLLPDEDSSVGLTGGPGFYDDELLDAHYIAGDGRANENIALTSVHHVFHAEHNRLVQHTKDVAIASNDVAFLNEWLLEDVTAIPTSRAERDALVWDGERLFQAARFGTEMQYQHLVFEEFARKIQPNIDIFFAATQVYDTELDPSIVAEFAHTVYRFGHSMLTETVDRYDADFNVIGQSPGSDEQLGLIAAFLNPLAFAASGATPEEAAGALVRGLTRQEGNEIDEFVTEALRNNLLGLPLDLASINIARGRDTGVPSLNAARRDFYDVTGDSNLKPYSSWVEFAQNLKHEASVINFIAAYGTHETILDATTLDEKRAAALAIVTGDGAPPDAVDFLNSTGEWAAENGITTTGVDDVDFWIGGLAERIMPFGGMLGSTFNFVFEEQMEKLQDGDRFYYLERVQGLNFLTELENNSFARMVMANTDAIHLPADIFSTPAFVLEVDQSRQFTGLGTDGRADPQAEEAGLLPLVLRDDPTTPGADSNYLRYTGGDHVVLGGTAGDDIVIGGLGDDTVYGDEGNDRLEGGEGNDFVLGGPGDDIMTDLGGDDNMQGGDGNDAIHGGNGANLILGGFGSDFIVTGNDPSEVFGGPGNDFILGARGNEMVFGNEGDDWIESGMSDGSAGENFDEFARDETVGNDVFIGNTIADRMDGEGGDDIMYGNGGQVDRYEGGSGFDWAGFRDDPYGVTADLLIRAFDETPVPLSNATVLARFTSIEGMSGSHFADVLRGDDNDAAALAHSGATGSILTNIALIDGLQELLDGMLGGPVTSFAGNIILGGGGSDILEGRGGDDLIDGDSWLNVQLEVVGETGRYDSMRELVDRVFSGDLNPGQIRIVREILKAPGPDFDTAVFLDVMSNYEITTNDMGDLVVAHMPDGTPGAGGTDVVRNVERLQFADQALVLDGSNSDPEGLLVIDDETPRQGQALTVSADAVTDLDNVTGENPTGAITGPIAYFWQIETVPGIFEDILIENAGAEVARATGPTFTPREFEVGFALRVRAIYKDADGVLENVFSAPTAVVAGLNAAPTGQLRISDLSPTETFALQAINEIIDEDGLPDPSGFSFQWQQSGLNGTGAFTSIAGATSADFTPTQAQVTRALRVVTTYTDLGGNLETVISDPTIITGDFIDADPAAQTLNGTAGQDMIRGGGGADTINGNAEDDALVGGEGNDTINGGDGNDNISGGVGNDTLNGGAGDDTFTLVFGDLVDTIDGGPGNDTYNIVGNAGANLFTVTFDGTSITHQFGFAISNVETVNIDLSDGTDTLSYGSTTAPVTVDLGLATASGFGWVGNVENVTGGAGDDTLIGSDAANELNGGGGVDTIDGGGGNDVITPGGGNDIVMGGEGDDTLHYTWGQGIDAFDGGDGNDTYNVRGTAGANNLEVVYDGTSIASMLGFAVADVENIHLDLLGGADTITHSATSAPVTVDLAAGTASGFASVANVENVTGTSGADSLTGNDSANTINGGGGVDTIDGGGGDDVINPGAGNDFVMGGAGNDTLNYTWGQGIDAFDGGAGNDTYNVRGTAGANNLEVVYDGTAIASMLGFAVADVENIHLDLLAGSDTLNYSTSTAPVTVNLALATASGFASIANIENITGGAGADSLTGDDSANVINGGAGVDTIDGGGGDDVINPGAGNDTVMGGAGNDTLNYTWGQGIDAFDGGAGNDTYNVQGTAAANDLAVVYNGTSITSMLGFAVANVESINLNLQGGSDTLNYSTTSAAVTVNLAAATASGFTSIANIENVTGGSGADTLTGNDDANVLNGGGGADVIDGGGGADVIIGGAGADSVNSGAADDDLQDVFRFNAANEFGDIGTNFDASGTAATDDRIVFGGSLNTAWDDVSNDDNFTFASSNGGDGETVVNAATVEALLLQAAEGVSTADLDDASAVTSAINAEFNFGITAGAGTDMLVVVNSTGGDGFSMWQWVQAAGGETVPGELALVGVFGANAPVTAENFDFV